MKNYILLVDDHSGSMFHLAKAAIKDFNATITAIKDSATAEMLDTVVSVVEVGGNVTLPIQVSNPHVLKPVTHWRASGGTPLWSGLMEGLNMLKCLPDIDKPDVSVLVQVTTDGEATDGHMLNALKQLMAPLLATGRWSFVARVPRGIRESYRGQLHLVGFPANNIQEWDTTEAGMAASTQAHTQAMTGYFRSRSAGAAGSSSFYTTAANVNLAALDELTHKVSLYVVPQDDNGVEIRPFVLRHRMDYLKGSAFYQLSKTEARVSETKTILLREQATGKIYGGNRVREMLGLPKFGNARVHPGDHKNFDIFIQSESVNRKLVGGSGVVYWKEIGVPFTQAELERYLGLAPAPAPAPAVPKLLQVPVSTKPTKSPIPVTPMTTELLFDTRDEARIAAGAHGIPQRRIVDRGPLLRKDRWKLTVPRTALAKAA